MALLENVTEQVPEVRQAGLTFHKMEPRQALRLLHLSLPQRGKGIGIGKADGGRNAPRCQLCAQPEERVEFFLGRIAVVDVRHGLAHPFRIAQRGIVVAAGREDFERIGRAALRREQEPAIGQAGVGNHQPGLLRVLAGGKECHHLAACIRDHQRTVPKAIAVIVHVAAKKEKGTLPHFLHRFVPQPGEFGPIGLQCVLHVEIVLKSAFF